MFSLIISIFAIAIVVALVAATLYYGGDVSTSGKAEAEVARSINELGQIKAALTTFEVTEGRSATSLQELVPTYLSAVPEGWGVEVPSQVAFESSQLLTGSEPEKLDKCVSINQKLNIPGSKDAGYTPPNCAEIDANFTGCCVAPTP